MPAELPRKRLNAEEQKRLDRGLDVLATQGALEAVKRQIEEGADPNTPEYAWTPLHTAAERGYGEMAEYLIKKGANIHAQDGLGRTPLSVAAWYEQWEIAKDLIKYGADPNTQDKRGWTPLHHAASDGHLNMVKYLVDNGANPHARNCEGRTPLHCATRRRHAETVEYLGQIEAAMRASLERKNAEKMQEQVKELPEEMQELLKKVQTPPNAPTTRLVGTLAQGLGGLAKNKPTQSVPAAATKPLTLQGLEDLLWRIGEAGNPSSADVKLLAEHAEAIENVLNVGLSDRKQMKLRAKAFGGLKGLEEHIWTVSTFRAELAEKMNLHRVTTDEVPQGNFDAQHIQELLDHVRPVKVMAKVYPGHPFDSG